MMFNSCKATGWCNNYNYKCFGWNPLSKTTSFIGSPQGIANRKVKAMAKFVNNETGYKDGRFIGFFHLPEILANKNCYSNEQDC